MKSLILASLIFIPLFANAQEFPEPMDPPRMVNDYAGMLNSQEKGLLENKLRNFRDSTSTEFSVVIIRSIGPYDISQYGAALAENWGIGANQRDNGLLMLIALEDKKISISTGYGLEGSITDAQSKRVIDQYIAPNFRDGRYFKGVDEATSILMAMASGQYDALPKQKSFGNHFLFVVFIVLIIITISRFRGTRKRHYGSRPMDAMTTIWMMGGLNSRKGRGFDSFSNGGGVFGGGSDFGGFGGGSFGGGGASGSW